MQLHHGPESQGCKECLVLCPRGRFAAHIYNLRSDENIRSTRRTELGNMAGLKLSPNHVWRCGLRLCCISPRAER